MASNRASACRRSVRSSRAAPSALSANGSLNVPGCSQFGASASMRSRSPSAASASRKVDAGSHSQSRSMRREFGEFA